MRSFVRKELDVSKPINLRKLSPVMKIYVGIVKKWQSSDWYQTNYNKRLEEIYMKQVQKDESLKEMMLAQLYKELSQNATLHEKGLTTKSVVLQIDSNYKDSLQRVLSHKDFLQYNMQIVEENNDLRIAFPDMPILVKVTKKSL